jgi:hypothetical protein
MLYGASPSSSNSKKVFKIMELKTYDQCDFESNSDKFEGVTELRLDQLALFDDLHRLWYDPFA